MGEAVERDARSWAGKGSAQFCEISWLCKLEGLSLDAQRPSENPGVSVLASPSSPGCAETGRFQSLPGEPDTDI